MAKKINNNLRWDPYVLVRDKECIPFWKGHFNSPNKRLLYILGKGFDFRMNMGIKSIIHACPNVDITCMAIEFDEGKSSESQKYMPLVKENYDELKKLIKNNVTTRPIELWRTAGKKKRRVGDKNVAELFFDYGTIKDYTDIIVDISSLPKGIYFSLVGKILSLIDANVSESVVQNFFVVTAENAEFDKNIVEAQPDDELSYVFGFLGGSELTSDKKPTIWLPILGESKHHQIRAVYGKIRPEEICPVLPFPSKNARRSDNLIIEYHQLLFDEFLIEAQNILYVSEQNPFEVYRTLRETIFNYDSSLRILNGCDVVISTFSSKLLSIGALLAAFEFKTTNTIKVGVLNVDSSGYNIKDHNASKSIVGETELFVTWLAGEPYKTDLF
jgi:hypothetical protein